MPDYFAPNYPQRGAPQYGGGGGVSMPPAARGGMGALDPSQFVGTGGGAGNPHDWPGWRPPGGGGNVPTTGPVGPGDYRPGGGTPYNPGDTPTIVDGRGGMGALDPSQFTTTNMTGGSPNPGWDQPMTNTASWGGGNAVGSAPPTGGGTLAAGAYGGPAGGLGAGGPQSGVNMPGAFNPDLAAAYAGANVVPGSMSTAGLAGGGGASFGPGNDATSANNAVQPGQNLIAAGNHWSQGANAAAGGGMAYTGGGGGFDEATGTYGGGGYGGVGSARGNPYLDARANDMQRRSGQFAQEQMAAARPGAILNGSFGGSAQDIFDSSVISQSSDNLMGQLAGMYGNAWESDQNRGLQRYQGDQSYDLGRRGQDLSRYQGDESNYTARRGQDQNFSLGYRGQDLQRYGMDQNFSSSERAQDRQDLLTGMDLTERGMDLPWRGYRNMTGILNPFTGFGNSTSSSESGGRAMGAAGGALGLWDIWQRMQRGGGA